MATSNASERWLAIDYSSSILSLALQVNPEEIVTEECARGDDKRKAISSVVHELLRKAGFTVADISGVLVGIGPGSFTGIRNSVSFAKGLTLGRAILLRGISSHAALACGQQDRVIVFTAAGKRDIFVSEWRAGQALGTVRSLPLPELEKWLENLGIKSPIFYGHNEYEWQLPGTVVEPQRLAANLFSVNVATQASVQGGEEDLVTQIAACEPTYIRTIEYRKVSTV